MAGADRVSETAAAAAAAAAACCCCCCCLLLLHPARTRCGPGGCGAVPRWRPAGSSPTAGLSAGGEREGRAVVARTRCSPGELRACLDGVRRAPRRRPGASAGARGGASCRWPPCAHAMQSRGAARVPRWRPAGSLADGRAWVGLSFTTLRAFGADCFAARGAGTRRSLAKSCARAILSIKSAPSLGAGACQ